MPKRSFFLDIFLSAVAGMTLFSMSVFAQTLPVDNYVAPADNNVIAPAPIQPAVQPAPEMQPQPAEAVPYQPAPTTDSHSGQFKPIMQPQPTQPMPYSGETSQPQPIPQPINNTYGPGEGGQYQYNKPPMMLDNSSNQNNYGESNRNQNNYGEDAKNFDQEKNQQQMNDRRIKDMKREAANIEREYNRVSKTFTTLEKGGAIIPQEVKDNLSKVKSALDAVKNVSAAEELDNTDMGELHGIMGDLYQSQNEIMQKAQQFKDLQRNIKQMEQGVKMFERQVTSLSKQKIAVPANITDTLNQLKTKIAEIKNAKSADQLDSSTFDDLQELMQTINESRQQLDMLARWPQTLKQVTQQLNNLNRQLKSAKSMVTRLTKQGIDLSDTYAKFQEAIDGLKAVKADAVAKVAAGNAEDAFTALEDGFFNEMENVMQYQRVIQTMANLGRFNSDFKQSIRQAQNQINTLKRQKIDVSELNDLLAQAKDQGAVVLAKMKEKPLDEEAVLAELQTMEDLRMQFDDKLQELGGNVGGPMPWEQGVQKSQIQNLQMPKNIEQFMNNNQNDIPPMENSGPTFAPGTGPNYIAP